MHKKSQIYSKMSTVLSRKFHRRNSLVSLSHNLYTSFRLIAITLLSFPNKQDENQFNYGTFDNNFIYRFSDEDQIYIFLEISTGQISITSLNVFYGRWSIRSHWGPFERTCDDYIHFKRTIIICMVLARILLCCLQLWLLPPFCGKGCTVLFPYEGSLNVHNKCSSDIYLHIEPLAIAPDGKVGAFNEIMNNTACHRYHKGILGFHMPLIMCTFHRKCIIYGDAAHQPSVPSASG